VELRFRKGRDIAFGKAPRAVPPVPCAVGAVAVMARDFPAVVWDPRVTQGQVVRQGQALCVDRLRPEIALVAAASGRVSGLHHGARRRLERIEIEVEVEGAEETAFDVKEAMADPASLRALLLKSGAWAAFRTRPFGRIPAPSDTPAAIFVTVTDSQPLAADPVAVLAPQMAAFQRGVAALLHLTEGPVFLCQPPGPALMAAQGRLRVVQVAGAHPAGLAGTHIHHLWPVSVRNPVWQLGGQDVAALGQLLESGRIATRRVVSVAGPGVEAPRLVSVPLGARLADLAGDAAGGKPLARQVISGSVLLGQSAPFLGRFDLQVTVLGGAAPAPSAWGRLLPGLPRLRTGATLPMERFEAAFPFDIPPAPLMRALAVGDVETAERLGCLDLLEEDLALLSWLCPSGCDYGALLRRVLDRLGQEAAA
jgi:Na+-transporting NADH:ubiquinone oxidoreductase subunit A